MSNRAHRFPLVRSRPLRISLCVLCMLAAVPGTGSAAQKKNPTAVPKPPAPPTWYATLPADAHSLFAKASATSKDKQLAIDKAVHDARVELGRMVHARLDSVRRSAEREAALDKDRAQRYATATEKISVDLKGSRVRNQKQTKKGRTWTAFVVVELPVGAASDAIVRAIQDDDLLSPTLGPTKAFRALDAEAAAYRAKRPASQKKK